MTAKSELVTQVSRLIKQLGSTENDIAEVQQKQKAVGAIGLGTTPIAESLKKITEPPNDKPSQ